MSLPCWVIEMKKSLMIYIVVIIVFLIAVRTVHKPRPKRQEVAEFCINNGKPFSTSVAFDQDEAMQRHNGFAACMKEKGVAAYADAPTPVKH